MNNSTFPDADKIEIVDLKVRIEKVFESENAIVLSYFAFVKVSEGAFKSMKNGIDISVSAKGKRSSKSNSSG